MYKRQGYYIGTSDEHYRCFNVYKTDTRAEAVSDTVFFKHKYITNSSVTAVYAIIQAAHDITQALQGNIPIQLDKSKLDELQLADIVSEKNKRHQRTEGAGTAATNEGAADPSTTEGADETYSIKHQGSNNHRKRET